MKYVAVVIWIAVGLFVIRVMWRVYRPYIMGEPLVTYPTKHSGLGVIRAAASAAIEHDLRPALPDRSAGLVVNVV